MEKLTASEYYVQWERGKWFMEMIALMKKDEWVFPEESDPEDDYDNEGGE